MRKFVEANGRLYALMNWKSRKKNADVAILRHLNEEEAQLVAKHKAKGLNETSIFELLFPEESKPIPPKGSPKVISIDTRDLSKQQLVQFLQAMMDTPMPSLSKLTRGDLETLLLGLCQAQSKSP